MRLPLAQSQDTTSLSFLKLVLAVRVERTQPVLQTGMQPLHQTRMEEDNWIEQLTISSQSGIRRLSRTIPHYPP